MNIHTIKCVHGSAIGTCFADHDPPDATAGFTEFMMTCVNWTGPTQLQYAFAFVDADGTEFVLGENQTSHVLPVKYLPAGQTADDKINIRAIIRAETYFSFHYDFSVKVYPTPVARHLELFALLKEKLTAAVEDGNPYTFAQALLTYSQILDAYEIVDAAIHRQDLIELVMAMGQKSTNAEQNIQLLKILCSDPEELSDSAREQAMALAAQTLDLAQNQTF
jgi:hypothetical protein